MQLGTTTAIWEQDNSKFSKVVDFISHRKIDRFIIINLFPIEWVL